MFLVEKNLSPTINKDSLIFTALTCNPQTMMDFILVVNKQLEKNIWENIGFGPYFFGFFCKRRASIKRIRNFLTIILKVKIKKNGLYFFLNQFNNVDEYMKRNFFLKPTIRM